MVDLISRQAAIDRIHKQREHLQPDKYPQDKIGDAAYRICAEFIERMPSVTPKQRWIPCGERMPEYGVEVLTINKDGEYEINHIIDDEDGEWFFDGAIAWMPLQPYKGDEE